MPKERDVSGMLQHYLKYGIQKMFTYKFSQKVLFKSTYSSWFLLVNYIFHVCYFYYLKFSAFIIFCFYLIIWLSKLLWIISLWQAFCCFVNYETHAIYYKRHFPSLEINYVGQIPNPIVTETQTSHSMVLIGFIVAVNS